jgi:hypothetical protein
MQPSHIMPIPVRLMGGTFLLGMTILFGCIGVLTLRRTYRLRTKGRRTDGMVVGVDKMYSSKGIRIFPTVEFKTLEGQKVTFTASTSGNRPPTIGRRVTVLYLPDKPSEADIPSVGSWIGSFFFLLFATGFLVLSAVFYLGLG